MISPERLKEMREVIKEYRRNDLRGVDFLRSVSKYNVTFTTKAIAELLDELERYRGALEIYADRNLYDDPTGDGQFWIIQDSQLVATWDIARKALRGEG